MRRTALKGSYGGWSASQIAGFVKNFVGRYPNQAWRILGDQAREGLVDSAILVIITGQDGGTIAIADIVDLRHAFMTELRERWLYRLDFSQLRQGAGLGARSRPRPQAMAVLVSAASYKDGLPTKQSRGDGRTLAAAIRSARKAK